MDERWWSEWFEYGFDQMIVFLGKRAAFEDYCQSREGRDEEV